MLCSVCQWSLLVTRSLLSLHLTCSRSCNNTCFSWPNLRDSSKPAVWKSSPPKIIQSRCHLWKEKSDSPQSFLSLFGNAFNERRDTRDSFRKKKAEKNWKIYSRSCCSFLQVTRPPVWSISKYRAQGASKATWAKWYPGPPWMERLCDSPTEWMFIICSCSLVYLFPWDCGPYRGLCRRPTVISPLFHVSTCNAADCLNQI